MLMSCSFRFAGKRAYSQGFGLKGDLRGFFAEIQEIYKVFVANSRVSDKFEIFWGKGPSSRTQWFWV